MPGIDLVGAGRSTRPGTFSPRRFALAGLDSPADWPAPGPGLQPSSRPDAALPAGDSALQPVRRGSHRACRLREADGPWWRLSGRTASPTANAHEVPWSALLPARGNPSRSSPTSSPSAGRKSRAGGARHPAPAGQILRNGGSGGTPPGRKAQRMRSGRPDHPLCECRNSVMSGGSSYRRRAPHELSARASFLRRIPISRKGLPGQRPVPHPGSPFVDPGYHEDRPEVL